MAFSFFPLPQYDEAFVAYVLLLCFTMDQAPRYISAMVSRNHFWFTTLVICAPVLILILTFAAATTSQSQWMISSAVCLHTTAAILVLAIPAASIPHGPSPEMQSFANAIFLCLTAVGWHAVMVKWEETRSEVATARLVRCGLVIGIAGVISASALGQILLGAKHFWSVCRIAAVLCGVIRLGAILLLYHDGTATSYPPGALPFAPAVAVVFVMPLVAGVLTPSKRELIARASGIPERLQTLANWGKVRAGASL